MAWQNTLTSPFSCYGARGVGYGLSLLDSKEDGEHSGVGLWRYLKCLPCRFIFFRNRTIRQSLAFYLLDLDLDDTGQTSRWVSHPGGEWQNDCVFVFPGAKHQNMQKMSSQFIGKHSVWFAQWRWPDVMVITTESGTSSHSFLWWSQPRAEQAHTFLWPWIPITNCLWNMYHPYEKQNWTKYISKGRSHALFCVFCSTTVSHNMQIYGRSQFMTLHIPCQYYLFWYSIWTCACPQNQENEYLVTLNLKVGYPR